jgi:hypothetical protein
MDLSFFLSYAPLCPLAPSRVLPIISSGSGLAEAALKPGERKPLFRQLSIIAEAARGLLRNDSCI